MSMKKVFSQEFKEDAVRYRLEHSELTFKQFAENLGVSLSALRRWMDIAKQTNGTVKSRGSGNYASEEAKEIARLKRELRNKEDALDGVNPFSIPLGMIP